MPRGRFILALAAFLLAATLGGAVSAPEDVPWRHALSLIDTPKYPPDFKHFDYVKPDAPKGGLVRLSDVGGFDSLNPVLATKGNPAPGLGTINESLMKPSWDEPSTAYGLIAEAVRYPPDFSWVSYRLRPEARWHDGLPITVADVIWSFYAIKEVNPNTQEYYSHVASVEQTGEREVTFRFDEPRNRELPQIVGELTVLPKHYWEGTDSRGRKRDIRETTLEPPLGSGPYRIKSVTANRGISYERVADYWGSDLPVNVGQSNFDELRYDVLLDETVQLQAFSGDQYDWREENSAKNWATGYDFPAVRQGHVIAETIPDISRGVMQAFVVNLRRERFQDRRVRMALDYALDFESMNRTVFFDQYKRDYSFFAGTNLASSGPPSPAELAILETVRGQVPEEVFTKPYENPVAGSPAKLRENLARATALLAEAGWVLKGSRLVNERTGQPFTIEFLYRDSNFDRVILPYQQTLQRLGIQLTPRFVDTSQYINRLLSFDFDMVTSGWGQSLSPGNEQRSYWGSAAADAVGSRNFAGIKDPAVDQLIDRVIYATDRDDLIAATKALDRVLLWNHFVIPQWYYGAHRIARWDRFGHPDPLPKYSPGFPDIWWYDTEKAARIGRAPQ
jgi:microcin C transport system substrate-binding protein